MFLIIVFLAVFGWSQYVVADIRFTMLYVTNPVIPTGTPYQIVWTGAQALANISFVSGGVTTLVEASRNIEETTYSWSPPATLNAKTGYLSISDGVTAPNTSPVFSFKDTSGDSATTSATSSQTSVTTAKSSATSIATSTALQTSATGIPSATSSKTATSSPTATSATSTSTSTPGSNPTSIGVGTIVAIVVIAILLSSGIAAALIYLFWYKTRRDAAALSQHQKWLDGQQVGMSEASLNYKKKSLYTQPGGSEYGSRTAIIPIEPVELADSEPRWDPNMVEDKVLRMPVDMKARSPVYR